jgi:uncharacterized protein
MSATSDASYGKDSFSPGEMKAENGRPDRIGETPVVSDQAPDSSLLPHVSEEGGAEEPAPAETTADAWMTEGTTLFSPESAPSSEFPAIEQPLFENYEYFPPLPPPRRKPDFADCLLFALMAIAAFFCSGLLMLAALHYHLFGVSTLRQANEEIHYRIGSQAAWYVFTLLFCMLIFPFAWHRSFFAGLQWRAEAAAGRIGRLIGAALACFIAAIVDELVIPGPANAPIDQTFRMPGAAWLLFGFGVTLAPLIEEIAYRGLLLPALCTACDWMREQFAHAQPLPPAEDGFPRWSMPAMIFASVLVSVPFALMHGEQTAYSIGPFLLLVSISLALCWVRLAVRSLAASVVVHSSYNLLLFSLMFLGTGGFRHLDRM